MERDRVWAWIGETEKRISKLVKMITRMIFNRGRLETTIVELDFRLLITGYGEKVNGVFIVSSSLSGGDF